MGAIADPHVSLPAWEMPEQDGSTLNYVCHVIREEMNEIYLENRKHLPSAYIWKIPYVNFCTENMRGYFRNQGFRVLWLFLEASLDKSRGYHFKTQLTKGFWRGQNMWCPIPPMVWCELKVVLKEKNCLKNTQLPWFKSGFSRRTNCLFQA